MFGSYICQNPNIKIYTPYSMLINCVACNFKHNMSATLVLGKLNIFLNRKRRRGCYMKSRFIIFSINYCTFGMDVGRSIFRAKSHQYFYEFDACFYGHHCIFLVGRIVGELSQYRWIDYFNGYCVGTNESTRTHSSKKLSLIGVFLIT